MQRRSTGLQGLVFGGLMAALIVLFALVPGLYYLMPIPLVLVYVRHGGRVAILAAVVSSLITMAVGGLINGLLAIPSGILPGLVLGYGLRHKWKPLNIGLAAVATSFVGFAMTYVVMRVGMFGGQDPIEQMMATGPGRDLLNSMVDAMEQGGGADQTVLQELREQPAAIVWALLPSGLFLAGAFSTWINWMLCRLTLPRFGYPVPSPTPFAEFRLPVWLVWLYGVAMVAAPLLLRTPTIVGQSWVGKLLLNVISPLGLIFALAGVAVAYGYAQRKQMARGTVILVIALAVLLLRGAAYQILAVLAMWDALFDFRGLGHGIVKRPKENT